MRIAIIGYGRMGKTIERFAKTQKIKVSQIIDSKTELEKAVFDLDEVAIEFTEPDTCIANLIILANKSVRTVCGTTGWHQHLDQVKTIYKNKAAFLYATNFSLGVNIFWQITASTAKIIDKFTNYDVSVHETHHNKKKDCPSGTALETADILLQNIQRKKSIISEMSNQPINPEELHVSYARCGNIIGDHEITFSGNTDSIKISHQGHDRASYANGAIECAKWLVGKQGFYNIHDYIKEIINAK